MPIPPAPYAFASISQRGHGAPSASIRSRARTIAGARRKAISALPATTGNPTRRAHNHLVSLNNWYLLPRPTYLPLFIALATAAAVLAMLFKFYWVYSRLALLTAGLFVFSGAAWFYCDYGPLMSAGSICHPIQRWPIHRRGGP